MAATRVFTVASGNPLTDGVAVGSFCSIYADGSTTTGYIARVTAVTSTTITTDATAKSGTIPADGTNNRTLRVGGAWAGPSGASGFPLNLALTTATNAAGSPVCVHLRSDGSYSSTAGIVASGILHLAGYAASYGDGGRATLSGSTTGASFNLVNFTTLANGTVRDIEFVNNGATGTQSGVNFNSTAVGWSLFRCVFRDFRGIGVSHTGTTTGAELAMVECEVYGCNQSNTADLGGVRGTVHLIRCAIHHNAGSNSYGASSLASGAAITATDCLFDSNGGNGFRMQINGSTAVRCDFRDNGSHAIAGTVPVHVESCNFLGNGGWAISNATGVISRILHCGFGSGTEANASGSVALPAFAEEAGTVTYAADVTPWADPANGDFTITLAAAKGAGRGSFLQTAAGYAGTTATVDIGAAQAADGGGGTVAVPPGGPFSYIRES